MAKATSKTNKKTATKAKAKTTKAKAAKPAKTAETAEQVAERKAARREAWTDFMEQVAAFREDGLGTGAIAEELGTTTNKVQMAMLHADVKKADRIKDHDPERIAAARDEDKCGWAEVAARCGDTSIGRVKSVYAEHTGREANQGYSVVSSRNPEKAAPKAKATASKKGSASEKTAAAKAKRKAVQKGRKAKSGSGNPSKG